MASVEQLEGIWPSYRRLATRSLSCLQTRSVYSPREGQAAGSSRAEEEEGEEEEEGREEGMEGER